MFGRLVRMWGNADHQPDVLDPPGPAPGSLYPYMRSPNDFDPRHNAKLNFPTPTLASTTAKAAAAAAAINAIIAEGKQSTEGDGTPPTPQERLRRRMRFGINEEGVDTFFNYARLWNYSNMPWDAEGLAFLDTGTVALKHAYGWQSGQFDFDREDYIDYEEAEGKCRRLCKAVYQVGELVCVLVRGFMCSWVCWSACLQQAVGSV